MLRAWADAPAIILSCPGPLRRRHTAVEPVPGLALPQCLLGGEAQLLAFAAAAPDLAPRLFFSPLPEIFAGPESLAALMEATSREVGAAENFDRTARPVHLRFGGTRSARILKEARNGLVLAEDHAKPPVSPSRHPFADGRTLPAHIRRLFTYDVATTLPVCIGGAAVPATLLDGDFAGADLAAPSPSSGKDGLEVVSAAEFRSAAWAAGPVRGASPHLRAAQESAQQDSAPFVILPWNLDHPGSTVPALIERTLRLQNPRAPTLRLLVLPFNYPGQTGLIRRMIRRVRENAEAPEAALAQLFIGRLTRLHSLPALLALTRVAWVDGNDPEYDWTLRRLSLCGFSPILLAASGCTQGAGVTCIPADDGLTIAAETRFGLLHFHTELPSLRALRQLLPLTRSLAARPPPPQAARRPAGKRSRV